MSVKKKNTASWLFHYFSIFLFFSMIVSCKVIEIGLRKCQVLFFLYIHILPPYYPILCLMYQLKVSSHEILKILTHSLPHTCTISVKDAAGGQTDSKFYLCITIFFLIRALSDDKSLFLFSDLAALMLEAKKKALNDQRTQVICCL